MRILHVETPSGRRLLCDDSGNELDGGPDLWSTLLRSGAAPTRDAHATKIATDLDSMRVLPPPRPGKIVGVGLNYKDHLAEAKLAPPETPFLFSKFPSSVVAHEEAIRIDPDITSRVDWEGELAVVIGHDVRDATPEEALRCVFGYTIANDVSARDIQLDRKELIRGKNLDTFCPLGPCIVTADEIGDPMSLSIQTRLNGEIVQSSNTSEMVFDISELLAFCSRSFTLEPGDVLLTGTPRGCGEYMDVKRSLKPGDLIEVEIEDIGALRNPVRA